MSTVGNITTQLASALRTDSVKSERASGTTDAGSSDNNADVSRSHILQFIQDLKDDAGNMPRIRADLVAEAKSDIENGVLGSDDDINATINALLAGF